ncbi:hypothetical protein [Mucisphaera sp.]|uniref:hypothetical protein n=1 Tax=Mucisphaera sp. TaxID=2913024 RepID=UPI003D102AC6
MNTRNLLLASATALVLGAGGFAVMPALAQQGPPRGPGMSETGCQHCAHGMRPERGPRREAGFDRRVPRDARGFRDGGQVFGMAEPGRRGPAFGRERERERMGRGGERGEGPRGVSREGQHGGESRSVLRDLFRDIELNEDQRAEIMASAQAYRAEMQAWREANAETLRDLQAEARDARELEDREQMAALMAEYRELRESAPKLVDQLESVRDTLTERQQTIFDENLEMLRERFERRQTEAFDRRGEGRRDGASNRRDRRDRPGLRGPRSDAGPVAGFGRQAGQGMGMDEERLEPDGSFNPENSRRDDQLDL